MLSGLTSQLGGLIGSVRKGGQGEESQGGGEAGVPGGSSSGGNSTPAGSDPAVQQPQTSSPEGGASPNGGDSKSRSGSTANERSLQRLGLKCSKLWRGLWW